jgi:hypothetical protein
MSALPRRFRPWAPDLPDDERRSRFREMRALASLLLWKDDRLVALLGRVANGDPEASEAAWDVMHALPSRRARRLLASFASLGTHQ